MYGGPGGPGTGGRAGGGQHWGTVQAAVQMPGVAIKGGKKKEPPPQRVGNALALRSAFLEIMHSADGVDPDPLTIPKCVECSHCGWPVWPREARAATRKTYERAGIERSYTPRDKKKKAAEGDEAAGEGEGDPLDLGDDDSEEEEEDANSVDTVEQLENKVSELEEENGQLKAVNDEYERTIQELIEERDKLKLEIEEKDETIEYLKESEDRWREKNSNLRIENGELRLVIDRQGSRIGDLESDMVKKLLFIQDLKEKFARFERRRQLMLTKIEGVFGKDADDDLSTVVLRFWQKRVADDTEQRDKQEMEQRRRREVAELKDQLEKEKERVESLRANVTRLKGSLQAAAQRFLMRAMSGDHHPWACAHTLRAWSAAHPTIVTENVLEETRRILKDTQETLEAEQRKTAQLTEDLRVMTEDRDRLSDELEKMTQQYLTAMAELTGNADALDAAAAEIARKAAERAAALRKEMEDAAKAAAQLEIDRLQAIWEAERQGLEDEIGGLSAQLEALKRGAGGGKGEEDELKRVVPRGQGTVCVGCMKQLVHRDVKQLPPVVALKPASKSRKEEKGRLRFFEKELAGMPDPEDFLHTSMWKSRRDPLTGIKYADFTGDPPWPKGRRSVSASALTPLKFKTQLKEAGAFKPGAFR